MKLWAKGIAISIVLVGTANAARPVQKEQNSTFVGKKAQKKSPQIVEDGGLKVLSPKDEDFLGDLVSTFSGNGRSLCENFHSDNHGRNFGVTSVGRIVANKLKLAAGLSPFSPHLDFSPLQNVDDSIRTICSVLVSTTNRHTDHLSTMPGICDDPDHFRYRAVDSETRTAFVFLEDNPNAFFNHGEKSVPVTKGNMVIFDGRIPHHTVVNKGKVKLLGPFDPKTFRLIITCVGGGNPCAIDAQCASNTCCTDNTCAPNPTPTCLPLSGPGVGTCGGTPTQSQSPSKTPSMIPSQSQVPSQVPSESSIPSQMPSKTPSS
eukprot:CAMPEP_0195510812 /NCGR_PEP_ID=MMETSP0794_2-20130614/3348_1 /TAXON_ID=515487 /ORGANISM="Stephanopyxis turris, Strain CCMP 815" /LENGTH=317 /DNA_ID=CAMNT_0040638303 /DNA_START=39 /DNA_END=989 /DNA_ORIENTATION=+